MKIPEVEILIKDIKKNKLKMTLSDQLTIWKCQQRIDQGLPLNDHKRDMLAHLWLRSKGGKEKHGESVTGNR